jgi:hypothetical protein
MDGLSRSTSRRRRGGLARAALVAVIAVVGLVAVPGTASAAGEVTPLLDCVQKLHGGSGWVAIFGYSTSSSVPVTLPVGPPNAVTPAASNGDQPTTFEPGTHHGVFTVPFRTGNSASWTVDGRTVTSTMSSKACPASTELPEDGNGTGPAIALAVAGVVGAVALRRVHRRSPAVAGAPVEDRDDA